MSDRDEREILSIAADRQHADDQHREAAQSREALREAAAEVGIAARHVDTAEDIVAQRRGAERARSARHRRIAMIAGAVVTVAVVAGVAWRLTLGRPAVAWHDEMETAASWNLDVSEGTAATLGWEDAADKRKVAVVTVEAARPRQDGTWFVNLDGKGLPADASRHQAVVVELEGTLPSARVYLESGADERWRSPPIAVKPTWILHRIALDAFEHQRRRDDGSWHVVGSAVPAGLDVLSVKVGWFVNPPSATGFLRVAEVGLE